MRYIGSKKLIVNHIEDLIIGKGIVANTFCDIFSGTSTVARHFKKKYKVLSNDLLYFSYVLQMATIENDKKPAFNKVKDIMGKNPFDYFDNIVVDKSMMLNNPFIYENYSPNINSDRQYFSNENALKIDFIRQTIEDWNKNGFLEQGEYYYLIAGLIEAIPYISNIAGTYGAYLKHWDKRSCKGMKLIELDIYPNGKENKSYNLDSNELIKSINGDILYIDPPYNSRQYAPNYHILETVARYDNPVIKGKTGMRNYDDIKSKYCMKRDVLQAFEDLIKQAKFEHIILSYSTEGIMSMKDIEKIMKLYGIEDTFDLVKIPYRRYKHRVGYVNHDLHELLFYIRKDNSIK